MNIASIDRSVPASACRSVSVPRPARQAIGAGVRQVHASGSHRVDAVRRQAQRVAESGVAHVEQPRYGFSVSGRRCDADEVSP